ncbi:flagellar FLiS export co-chaperone [Helicobacter monodelphidis]|uniref:flagellar FLiS export co-chaperone n=1 Tax=Helicobacter sp. 15-1451 TaxID=2004995 RepID=UPI0015EB295C|nr:flagellar FLiS export co-chaperone [Helicobacter sp. 15-1451]
MTEINTGNAGLSLALLKSRLGEFSNVPTSSSNAEFKPNATENKGMITPKQDSLSLSSSNFEVLAFTKSVKGANEFIGALQTANVTLKKIDKAMSEGADTGVVSDLAEKSSFMGNKLFNKNLLVSVGGKDFSLTLQNPADLSDDSRGEYISSKRAEIAQVLSDVNVAVSSHESMPSVPTNGSKYNFEEFDAEAFKKMF